MATHKATKKRQEDAKNKQMEKETQKIIQTNETINKAIDTLSLKKHKNRQ